MEDERGSTSSNPQKTNCVYCFDLLWFCLSPYNQAREYYIRGEFDTCGAKASALYMCLAAKVNKDPDVHKKIKTLLDGRPLGADKPVWELKEKPGWY